MVSAEGLLPWDRRPSETPRAYDAFRRYRDLGPLRSFDALEGPGLKRKTLHDWSSHHDWRDRAQAWDDELHRTEDAHRLEAIRTMHDTHQRAGRAVLQLALRALAEIRPEDIPPYAAARLLELGARLERDIVTHSVEELQGIAPPVLEDPWEAVADELDRSPESH